ncbi:hypothetical protein [Geodermatophilus maliterrae]|uniref:Uncharacterized protein n=1 Tax=Geodermatophilus maliterrae TaxID=3162531 RepID=A0ABV3XLA3_9ACTN
MESDDTTDRTTAAAQLATLRADRAALADRLEHSGSWWPWDVGLGLWVFLVIGSQSLQNDWVRAGAVVLALLGVRVVYVLFRRATGVWVDGWRRGRTRRGMWAWVAWVLVVYAAAFTAENELGLRGAMAVGGVVLGVTLAAFNRWWMRVYVAELRGER